ncbi:hypothetical protein Tco_1277306 [Tanacetum coccineum]
METYSCEFCEGSPHPRFDCQTGDTPFYDRGHSYNQDFGYDQPPYYSPSQPQQFDCCEVCGGPHCSSDCQTRNPLVYEPNPGNNSDFPYFDQPPYTKSILRMLRSNPPVSLIEESDDVSEVIFDEEKFSRQQSIAPVTPPPFEYTPPLLFLATMKPLDTLLMGDEVISTTPTRENDEFIKSSVDDLVPIPRESELVNWEINFNPYRDIEELKRLLANDPIPFLRESEDPISSVDHICDSSDVAINDPQFEIVTTLPDPK